jgi:O-antigen/teichoic acid export membrane protein
MINNVGLEIDSFGKRYAFKLLANVSGIIIGLISFCIVPRALGPKHFGDYSFLTNVYTQVINFLDMRASTCLYIKLSQNKEDRNIIPFYSLFGILIIIILLISTWIITSNQSMMNNLLPDQERLFVYMAVVLTMIMFIQEQLSKIMDSYGLTVFCEKNRLYMRVANLLLIVVYFYFLTLNLKIYFLLNIISWILFILIILYYLKKINVVFSPVKDSLVIKEYAKVFSHYCAPLVAYMIIGFLSDYFDRWILQKYGGSIQQGYYAFAFNISNISMIAVSSIFILFTRELSVSFGKNDIRSLAKLFDAYVPSLYLFVTYLSCFFFFQADNIIHMFGGESYKSASFALKILSIYPLVSTYSMMSGSIIYATERTVIFRNLSLILAPLGALTSIILISPIVGMNLGAAGLGIKNLSVEFISVVVILFINARYLNVSFKKYFYQIIYIPVIFLFIALVSSGILRLFGFMNYGILLSILIFGTIYSVMSVSVVYCYPSLIFRNRNDVFNIVKLIKNNIGRNGESG